VNKLSRATKKAGHFSMSGSKAYEILVRIHLQRRNAPRRSIKTKDENWGKKTRKPLVLQQKMSRDLF